VRRVSIRIAFLLVFAILLALLAGVFYLMTLVVQHQAVVAEAELRRHESYKLADELRQSSDDLTRMARTYVVTGDPAFEEYFQRILAIRNGDSPRPEGYDGIYWDFVTASRATPAAGGEAVALQELMRRMDFTEGEFAKLREAQESSDTLVALEERAMAAVKGLLPDPDGAYVVPGEPDLELARELMHGQAYHEAKAAIMAPIDEFFRMVQTRTTRETEILRDEGRTLAWMAIGLMGVAAGLLVLSYVMIRLRVVRPVRNLAVVARQVEAGDYQNRVAVRGGDELAQLSRTFNEMSAAIERDVEERQRSAAELAEARKVAESANRAKSAFLANMSHELRTPMNAIIGYSEMLIEEMEEKGEQAFIPDLEKVNVAGKHLLALINDILDLSKIEAGRMDLYLERFDVRQVLEEAVSTVKPLIKNNGNTLETDFGKDLGTMRADLTKVRQSLFNLLSNATKFTENGTITLSAMREPGKRGDRIILAVHDTGIGIPADKLDKVFEEFSQADASTTRDYGGTGLGLPISRSFCRMMGGDITVDSRPGEGSTFTILLPAEVEALEAARQAADAVPAEASVGPIAPAGSTAPTVLVIDDDPAVRDLLGRTLARDGYAVETAASGEEGLKLARERRPAAITLDVMMPSMNGWVVLRELKADPALREIPVIMVTIVSDRQMGFTLGASEYLTKPVDRPRLLELMRKFCTREGTARVLVIEDDEASRTMIRRTLESAELEVVEAENGARGLEELARGRPDVILLDLMMPVMDGFEFLRRLRDGETGRDIPVLVLTAKELEPGERRFLDAHAESVVEKHADALDDVLAELRRTIAAKHSPQ